MNDLRLSRTIVAALIAVGCGGNAHLGTSGTGRTSTKTCTGFEQVTELSPALPAGDAYDAPFSDGLNVYFSSDLALYRVPVSGGPAETVYTGPLGPFFAVGGGVVAWVPVDPGTGDATGLMLENADGIQNVTLPAGVLPSIWAGIVADADGNVFFDVDLTAGSSATWRWDPSTKSAAEMPGVGSPDGGGTNLYWADRGQIVWANSVGLYITDISTGTPRLLVAGETDGFGSLVGLDADNVYGAGDICPKGACPFTISGVPRAGGEPFVAFQSVNAYWTNGLQADDSGLYWMDWETFGIFRAELNPSGPAKHIVDPGSGIAEFALDACNLYWLEVDSTQATRVMAIAKP